jgi:exopolyphosphatase/guanosine-5'-triphosphate,3'-diphosphate pyrophosphatase
MKRYAAIDIGSQTIRLLIADCDSDTLYPIERDRRIVQLGSCVEQTSRLHPDKIEQSVTCIQHFCERAREKKTDTILAVATACVRLAENKRDFIKRVEQTCRIVPKIIDGQQEAELSRAGVLAVLPYIDETIVIVDIGGGSTELSFLASGIFKSSCSLALGVIAPSERFMHTNPPNSTEIDTIRTWIQAGLSPAAIKEPFVPAAIIATAGTATTLAAINLKLHDYEPVKINGHKLSRSAINTMLQIMIALPLEQRVKLPGLESGRAEVIIPGAMILKQILNYFHCDTCTICDSGLLEGIVLQHASLGKIVEKT